MSLTRAWPKSSSEVCFTRLFEPVRHAHCRPRQTVGHSQFPPLKSPVAETGGSLNDVAVSFQLTAVTPKSRHCSLKRFTWPLQNIDMFGLV